MAHIPDVHSQDNLVSIEDIDIKGHLVHDEMNDFINEDMEGVDMLIVRDGEDGNSNVDGEETFSPVNDYDEPILGKVFVEAEDAYIFYNHYAMTKGFGTRKFNTTKSSTTGEIIRRIYVFNKEGKKPLTDKGQQEIQCHRETRTGCMARMEVTLKNGKRVVDKFINIHNHTNTPTKVWKHRSYSTFHRSVTAKVLMNQFNEAGLRPAQITKAVNIVNGSQEMNITQKQCSEHLRNERKNNVSQECYGIIKHFQEKAMIDGSYYFTMNLAKDGSLRSVFWADTRIRSSYSQFGVILVFDVTYKTNKFMLPFAPFIDVNHHRQSILFGAVLLEDETEEIFVWLFEQFLKCMFDKPPVAMITDRDGATCNAIKKVFLNTHHRFCAWHIRKHVLEHLQPLRSRYDDFSETYNKWVKSRTIKEFEMGWEALNEL